MTVKKAIMGLDLLIKDKQKVRTGMLDPTQPWNKGKDMSNDLAGTMATVLQRDVDWLQAIKRQLLSEQHRTRIVCRHPKKVHDVADGQKYCMNCNANL